MDLDPTSGRPGTIGPSRTTSALATEARRTIPPLEVERHGQPQTHERSGYASPGLRPPGELMRDVVLQLSPQALALAKSEPNKAPRVKGVDGDSDEAEPTRRRPSSPDDRPERPRSRIDVRV